MSKADEMFEELGYKKKSESSNFILYENEYTMSNRCYIYFDLKKKLVQAEDIDDVYEMKEASYLNVQELKAINEKVKELGWLDE